jgi:hypothetical protein
MSIAAEAVQLITTLGVVLCFAIATLIVVFAISRCCPR